VGDFPHPPHLKGRRKGVMGVEISKEVRVVGKVELGPGS
jgi:hypothetical protein